MWFSKSASLALVSLLALRSVAQVEIEVSTYISYLNTAVIQYRIVEFMPLIGSSLNVW